MRLLLQQTNEFLVVSRDSHTQSIVIVSYFAFASCFLVRCQINALTTVAAGDVLDGVGIHAADVWFIAQINVLSCTSNDKRRVLKRDAQNASMYSIYTHNDFGLSLLYSKFITYGQISKRHMFIAGLELYEFLLKQLIHKTILHL